MQDLRLTLLGWFSGIISTIVLGLLWPYIFPAIINPERYYGAGPGLFTIIGLVLVVITPAALLGGFVGGRINQEGGASSQRIVSMLVGMILSLPFACMGLWFFTGF